MTALPPIGSRVLVEATVVFHNRARPGDEGPGLPIPCVQVRDGVSFGVACEDLLLPPSPGAGEDPR